MDTNDLRIFKEVYESGSLAQASGKCFMTPQGVSRIIRKIETELGYDLFVRTQSGMEPTKEADKLYANTNAILLLLDPEVADKRTLTIVFSIGLLSLLSRDYVKQLRSEFREYHLRILEENDEKGMSMLEFGEADFGIMGGPINASKLDISFFDACPHVAILNEHDPLCAKKKISIHDLNGRTIAMPGHQFNPYQGHMNRFALNGIRVNVIEVSELQEVHILARKNAAIGISVEFVAEELDFKHTEMRYFEETEMQWNTYYVIRKERASQNQEEFSRFQKFSNKYLKLKIK